MEQQHNEQKPAVRRRYSPVPEAQIPEPSVPAEVSEQPKMTDTAAYHVQSTTRRRALRSRIEPATEGDTATAEAAAVQASLVEHPAATEAEGAADSLPAAPTVQKAPKEPPAAPDGALDAEVKPFLPEQPTATDETTPCSDIAPVTDKDPFAKKENTGSTAAPIREAASVEAAANTSAARKKAVVVPPMPILRYPEGNGESQTIPQQQPLISFAESAPKDRKSKKLKKAEATDAVPQQEKENRKHDSAEKPAKSTSPKKKECKHKVDEEPAQEPKAERRTPQSYDMRSSGYAAPTPAKQPKRSQRPAAEKKPDADPPTAEKTAGKPPLKKRLPYYIGIAICSVVLVVSGTMLIRYYTQIWRANSASNKLRDLYNRPAATATVTPGDASEPMAGDDDTAAAATATQTPTPTPRPAATAAPKAEDIFLAAWPKKYPGNEQMIVQERFTSLRHQNRDIVGWLTIDGVVDEPVFQRDNAFYLNHDATGASNPTGALFLDESCNLRTVPMMALIHGHNMKEGAMFGSLKKYKVKDASFYKAHPYITFDTLYEKATYVIFAVAEVNIVPGNTHYFPFWHRFNFDTQQDFDHFVLLAKEYSRFKVDIDVKPGDRLLTLATCSSEDSNLRLIVMARMLRENEDTIKLSNSIYSAVAK